VALCYKVTEYYSPQSERTVLWNDPALGIDWKVAAEDAILSAKDRVGVRLAEAEVFA
jgi:dTDP-4-dehydrorhamnose 3,5-epimerase